MHFPEVWREGGSETPHSEKGFMRLLKAPSRCRAAAAKKLLQRPVQDEDFHLLVVGQRDAGAQRLDRTAEFGGEFRAQRLLIRGRLRGRRAPGDDDDFVVHGQYMRLAGDGAAGLQLHAVVQAANRLLQRQAMAKSGVHFREKVSFP